MAFQLKRPSNALLGIGLAVMVTVMFSFAYANVPLFKFFCERFGIAGSGKAGAKGAAAVESPSSATGNVLARNIHVKFMGVSGSGLPVRFGPSAPSVMVRPGKPIQVAYTFT